MTISKTEFAVLMRNTREALGPVWGNVVREVLRAFGAPTADPGDVPEQAYKGALEALKAACEDRGVKPPVVLLQALTNWPKTPDGMPVCVHGVPLDSLCEACYPVSSASALQRQEGGQHYKDLPIQPVEYIHANKVGYFEGNVIKYVTRWRSKGGLEDLRKARHYLDLLIDLEEKAKAEIVR